MAAEAENKDDGQCHNRGIQPSTNSDYKAGTDRLGHLRLRHPQRIVGMVEKSPWVFKQLVTNDGYRAFFPENPP